MRVTVLAVWTDQPGPPGPLTALERAQLSVLLSGSECRECFGADFRLSWCHVPERLRLI